MLNEPLTTGPEISDNQRVEDSPNVQAHLQNDTKLTH